LIVELALGSVSIIKLSIISHNVLIHLWHGWGMAWLQVVRERIALKDGRCLVRLNDVHEMIDEFPPGRATDGHWTMVKTLLEEAARNSSHAKLRALHEQLCRALAFDRMI